MLHGYFGIDSADDGRKRREKVIGKLLALDQSLEDALPYLFALLGIQEGEDPLGAGGRADPAAAHAGSASNGSCCARASTSR